MPWLAAATGVLVISGTVEIEARCARLGTRHAPDRSKTGVRTLADGSILIAWQTPVVCILFFLLPPGLSQSRARDLFSDMGNRLVPPQHGITRYTASHGNGNILLRYAGLFNKPILYILAGFKTHF
jgi:hypothetical protein